MSADTKTRAEALATQCWEAAASEAVVFAAVVEKMAILLECAEKAEAESAKLRAALFKLRAAAHHAEIWLTSCLDCKDWMWSEHQHEAATEARDELKAALNGEEAAS